MVGFHWNICVPDSSRVSMFAAEEFARLISAADPEAAVSVSRHSFSPDSQVLWIGMAPAFPKPQVEDPTIDDAIYIDVHNGAGVITGVNERSVLIAVYRFFREIGCVFLHPGRDGEYIPQKDSTCLCVTVNEAAAYRHRGICLEGSNSYENVADMIDWAPKLGFNAYFTQLFRPAFAFRRWYEHYSNPAILPTPVSNHTIDAFVEDYSQQIALRGMLHHRIGHGWASKLLGYTSGAWHELDDEANMIPGRKKLIAWINGEQQLFHGSGIDTNLCYSNPEVQRLLVEEVVAYAKANPNMEYLHFWFADTMNNQCECAACAAARPSDHYVTILNQIDAALSREGLGTKIVFLIYLDLLWEPEQNRLIHPERFVLMFAPIRRSYSVPMESDRQRKAIPYVRNGFTPSPEAGGALPYLKAWQTVFDGDSFIFDYHYMWDYINDPGCYQSIQIMAQDVEDYRKLGLNGLMSCQNQRVFMPNGFGMNVMGNSLWDGKSRFHQTADGYFEAAYGKDGMSCLALLKELSHRLDPVVLRGEKPVRSEAVAQCCAEIPAILDAFLPVIARNLRETTGVQHRFWECLQFYAELCRKLSGLLHAAACGNHQETDTCWAQIRSYVCDNELSFQKEFDVFEFLNIWENKILYRFMQQEELYFE